MTPGWDMGDPEVDAFVDANLVSFGAWDLIVYLNREPEACETLGSFAEIVARHEDDLRPALRQLVEAGVVELVGAGDGSAARYRLSRAEETRRVVARFARFADKRDYRLEFVRRVLARLNES